MTLLHPAPTGFAGTMLRPGDDGYEQARRVWNGAIDRRPAFVARCRSTTDVAAMVRFGVRHGLPIAVRGGGHSIPGLSVCEGGLVIDLSPMKAIAVDPVRRRADVGPGVLWAEFDRAAQEHGLAVPGGEISDTGVAGLTLGGGVGWLSRAYGLACDSLVAAEVVTADGSVLHVDEQDDPELLWGLRGGGGNFGVVTRFTFRLYPVPVPMYGGMLLHPIERGGEALRAFLDLGADAPDELGLNAAIITAPPAPFVPPELQGRPVVALAAGYVGPPAEGEAAVRPLRQFAPPAVDLLGPMPYTALQSIVDEAAPPGLPAYVRSEWLGPLDDAAIDTLLDRAAGMTSPLSQVLVRIMGGAVGRVAPDATAFRYREAAAMLTLAAVWTDPADQGEEHRAWTRRSWEALRPWSAGGGYVNHLCGEGPGRVREAYGERTWARLVALKRRLDPGNVFHLNQNVPPEG
ncbi:FAD-binding oxidoreductase [Pseudonocardia nigra]|uniref:FAD-binding oxidoreductase n=1 Tax=Pseudonocardia nigra TaxID=1921578 RepID=UPI001C5D994A|nr:FAD-binding oxidoreductase [Pseudonocardia nigra]